MLYDMHFHLSWVHNFERFSQECDAVALFGVSTQPKEFELVEKANIQNKHVYNALGLHPWYMGRTHAEGPLDANTLAQQLLDFECFAHQTRYIGEIGMDAMRGEQSCQQDTFERICSAIQPGSILSVHNRYATEPILAALLAANVPQHSTVIFHSFLDGGEQLAQARKIGAYFSFNARGLATKRGAEYARQTPLARLLLETDLPAYNQSISMQQEQTELHSIARTLAELHQVDEETILKTTAENAKKIMGK